MEKYIGKVLNDRYMITEVIGVGGMAYVFKAFDKVCNRVVAVKVLKDEFMSDAQFRRRFTNESKAITMLSHNNIVDVYDVSLEGESLYIVMEYIDGITLKEYMEKKGALSDVEALHFVKQILKGLAHAHERGIVHRDIKPHNIILLKDGTIKITDFGIARLTKFDTQTISDMTIGSVHYISPEQASGDRTDERSDIYSVGIILYEMLTGKLPFEADTAVAVALMQVQAQPELPTEINDQIKQGLEEITLKAIMKDPAIRYQSAGALLADISLYEANPEILFNYTNAPIEEPVDLDDNSPTRFISDIYAEEEEDPFDQLSVSAADAVKIDEEDDAEEEETSKSVFLSTWLPILGGVGAALLALLIAVLIFVYQKEIGDFFGAKKVSCPYFIGMTIEEAKSDKDVKNFELKIVEDKSETSDEPAGTIISQNPAKGTKVKKGDTIKVTISAGKPNSNQPTPDTTDEPDDEKEIKVPNVLEMSKEEALDKFRDKNILFDVEYDYDDNVEEGYVISTSPKAGITIYESTTVKIVISKGPEAKKVEVPGLLGMTKEKAETTLKNLGLKVEFKEVESEKTAGTVIKQSVDAGDKVEAKTTITVTIAKAPANQTPDTGDQGNQGGTEDGGGNGGGESGNETTPGNGDENNITQG